MPKEPKRKMSAKIGQSTRHAPLGQVIQDDVNRDRYASMKKLPRSGRDDDDDVEESDTLLDVKTSKRILELSKEQIKEVEEEEVRSTRRRQQEKVRMDSHDSSDEESEVDEDIEEDDDLVQHDEGYVSMSNTGLTPEEEALLSNMMGGVRADEPQRKTLADIIMEKIEEKEAMADLAEDENCEGGVELPAKVIQVSL
jgi:essential nuclear protein 1